MATIGKLETPEEKLRHVGATVSPVVVHGTRRQTQKDIKVFVFNSQDGNWYRQANVNYPTDDTWECKVILGNSFSQDGAGYVVYAVSVVDGKDVSCYRIATLIVL